VNLAIEFNRSHPG